MTEQEMQELFPLIDQLTQITHKIDKENQRLRQALEDVKTVTWKEAPYTVGGKAHHIAYKALAGEESE